MNHFSGKLLSAVLAVLMVLPVLLFAGCAGSSEDMKQAHLSTGDFQYTLSATELEYNSADINAKKPFEVTLSIEYTGSEDSITLWCVDELGTITMEDGNGQPILQPDIYHRETSEFTLQKGVPYVITWTGADEYKEYDGFPAGDYKVVAYINFSTDPAYESIQENTLDLSLKIK